MKSILGMFFLLAANTAIAGLECKTESWTNQDKTVTIVNPCFKYGYVDGKKQEVKFSSDANPYYLCQFLGYEDYERLTADSEPRMQAVIHVDVLGRTELHTVNTTSIETITCHPYKSAQSN